MGDLTESLETTSTSSTEDTLNIAFEHLSYSVRSGFLNRGQKIILNDVSGSFNAGELTVIVGQSGAGKSTLLDLLSGYTQPTSGSIFVNGRPRNDKMFRRRSCYILQDDKVQDWLSIQESLVIAADLKLGNHISGDQKKRRIEEIIASLGLGSARNTRARNLSGGQKKRLAIGLELISDPSVMIIDEPTSGLDSSISKQLVYLLHQLARQGRTVVVTMHQPSAALLSMVDRLYAVAAGQCAYMGSVHQLLTFLEQMNLVCPPYHNPVDFLIESCAENTSHLVEYSENGRNMRWIADISQKTDDKLMNQFDHSINEDIQLTLLPTPKENPTNKILLKLKSTYPTSFWKQFITLTRRTLLTVWRNPTLALMNTFIHLIAALMMGVMYYNIGAEASEIRNNYNFLYFSIMFLMFTAFSGSSIHFPEQLPIVRREHFNRWYTTAAYYFSTLAAALPTQTICTLAYVVIAYWMTGQAAELVRFVAFSWILMLVTYVALCLGYLNGSIFDIKNGVIFGPFLVTPFTIFSGFFLRYDDAPSIFRWVFHISFLKHGLVGISIPTFGMDRPKLPCSEIYCHYRSPKFFLKDIGMLGEKYSIAVLALLAIGFFITIGAYIILRIRLKRKW